MRYSVSRKQFCVCAVVFSCLLVWLGKIELSFVWFRALPPNKLLLRVYDDYSTDIVVTEPPQEVFTEEELLTVDKLNLPQESYKFHPSCNCSR